MKRALKQTKILIIAEGRFAKHVGPFAQDVRPFSWKGP